MPVVGYLSLHNTGAFVARLGVKWIVDDSEYGPVGMDQDTDVDQTSTLDPGMYNVPSGATIWAYVDVVWGDDKEGSPQDGGGLMFRLADEHTAQYHIHGTTHDDHLGFDGISPPE
jgi:hypothetical protein